MKYFVLIALLCAGCASQPGAPSKGGGSSGSSVPAANGSPSTAPAPKSTDSDNAAPSGSEAPVRTASTADSGGGGSAVQTPDERKAAIDRKLDDSLGTFDKELKKEQERTAQERDARGAPAAASGSAQTEAESATKESSDEAGSSATESPPAAGTADKTPDGQKADRHARPGDLKSDKDRAANAAASGSGATARDIPDGSDDDIVAKRLRKAAEQETDPELKDKLWKEYIEYKKNAGK